MLKCDCLAVCLFVHLFVLRQWTVCIASGKPNLSQYIVCCRKAPLKLASLVYRSSITHTLSYHSSHSYPADSYLTPVYDLCLFDPLTHPDFLYSLSTWYSFAHPLTATINNQPGHQTSGCDGDRQRDQQRRSSILLIVIIIVIIIVLIN